MRHKPAACEGPEGRSDDLFRARLDQMIGSEHPLVKLAYRMPWGAIAERLVAVLPPEPAGAGRPALPMRLVVGLLYLKHAYNLSDERVCALAGEPLLAVLLRRGPLPDRIAL